MSNENTNTNETIADIVRAMRNPPEDGTPGYYDDYNGDTCYDSLKIWADRIEAAAERDARIREDEATESAFKRGEEIHAQHCANCVARDPGSAAAMREALELFVNHASCLYHCDVHRLHPETTSCDGVLADDGECPMKTECDAVFKGRAALSAPARNCDRFATKEGAATAFAEERGWWIPQTDLWRLAPWLDWLFAPAEGGAE